LRHAFCVIEAGNDSDQQGPHGEVKVTDSIHLAGHVNAQSGSELNAAQA
jgi:hypothetical protein